MSNSPIRLRPHHLGLCLQTYSGRGYSEEFVANMTAVAERLNAGAAVKIVRGPDDICAPMLKDGEKFHCYDGDVKLRDALALQAINRVLTRPVAVGAVFQPNVGDWQRLRAAFRDGSMRQGCDNCSWKERCDAAAAHGFVNSKMRCGL
jgi:uncharacterized protein